VFIASLALSLRDRLLLEERAQQILVARELLGQIPTEFQAKLTENSFWEGIHIEQDYRKIIISRVSQVIDPIIQLVEGEQPMLVHQISALESRTLLSWIDESLYAIPPKLKAVTMNLESRIRELRHTEEALSRVPPDEIVAPLVQRLNNLNQELGRLNKEMKEIEERIAQTSFKTKENERLLAKRIDEQQQAEAEKQRIVLGTKVQEALAEFSERLKRKKLSEVSDRLVGTFNALSNKKNRVNRIAIGERDFSVTLFRQNGTKILKDELSAGEKQVYAIAMLTALAQVSGRPLPFMIDTPLARLDIEHRTNLVSNFFPKVSHQVIIFSTDSEVDRIYFEQLAPFVSKAYLLNYTQDENTVASEGYFWKLRQS